MENLKMAGLLKDLLKPLNPYAKSKLEVEQFY